MMSGDGYGGSSEVRETSGSSDPLVSKDTTKDGIA